MHEHMKTISIRDEVYKNLRNMKREGESFSDVIERLLERKNLSIRSYFGILKDNPVLDEIEEIARRTRETARPRT